MAAARRAVLQEALDHILANRAGALAGADPEYLHQLRVGTRRLRAALTVFGDMMRAEDARALRRTLRALARVAGPARDWDVFMPRVPAPLRTAAERRRRSAYAALRRVLRAPQLWLLPRSQAVPRVTLPAFARQALERAERKALRRGARIDWSRAGKRHALRIRLRRLRYASEFLRGAFPDADAEPFIRSLKDLQDLLGALNDLEVARQLMAELTGAAPRHDSRRARLIARLPAAWQAFAGAPRFWR
ncbi:MAG: CHAD domain-containing protein [Betaproteobacteria bacterium]|nr:CHAD domain-containing protein [Betaproteobacteria bacterium]MDH5351398.1 CHAD domain-containing protein [Betaproteobacteria bacterium]